MIQAKWPFHPRFRWRSRLQPLKRVTWTHHPKKVTFAEFARYMDLTKGHLVGGWTNPFEKYYIVKLNHFPRVWGENKKPFETTTWSFFRWSWTGLVVGPCALAKDSPKLLVKKNVERYKKWSCSGIWNMAKWNNIFHQPRFFWNKGVPFPSLNHYNLNKMVELYWIEFTWWTFVPSTNHQPPGGLKPFEKC